LLVVGAVGAAVGPFVGAEVGFFVVGAVGFDVGAAVGNPVGELDTGAVVCVSVGFLVGFLRVGFVGAHFIIIIFGSPFFPLHSFIGSCALATLEALVKAANRRAKEKESLIFIKRKASRRRQRQEAYCAHNFRRIANCERMVSAIGSDRPLGRSNAIALRVPLIRQAQGVETASATHSWGSL
jgi:hypothetical protein